MSDDAAQRARADEEERLEVLQSFDLLDSGPEPEFDALTRVASFIVGAPIALISLVDHHRQWFKSRLGLHVAETPREIAFCAHALDHSDVMVVPDASVDPRFADNPLVTSDPQIRFYAGAPLRTREGHALGTLCVIDRIPRTLNDGQKEALSALAQQVMTILELRRALHERTEFLDAVLENVREGVVACDAKANLRLFNRATREFHGLSEEALPPEVWATRYDLYQPDAVTPLQPDEVPLFRAFREEVVRDQLMAIAPKDRPPRIVSSSGRAMFDRGGKKIGAVVTMRDVTERKNAEEFIATLSHELKTPMTSILGWTRVLQMPDLDEVTSRAALRAIEESALAQSRLIDDMLDVSGAIAGKMHLAMADGVDVAAVCAQAIEVTRPSIVLGGIKLESRVGQTTLLARADAHRLMQVFWNLLSNSVKFTPPGGSIEVAAEQLDGHAVIRVSDTGKGIAPTVLPHIFEKFHQASDSTSRGSLGLGLAIVRHIVEAHEGTIVAASAGEGLGATFTVTLPLHG